MLTLFLCHNKYGISLSFLQESTLDLDSGQTIQASELDMDEDEDEDVDIHDDNDEDNGENEVGVCKLFEYLFPNVPCCISIFFFLLFLVSFSLGRRCITQVVMGKVLGELED